MSRRMSFRAKMRESFRMNNAEGGGSRAVLRQRGMTQLLFPYRALVLGRLAAFDHGELGSAADTERFAHFSFDFGAEVAVLFDEELRVFAALAQAHIAVGEPRSRFLDDLVFQADVGQVARLGN